MKKNRMMRLASGLLVAVLITTSMISGTFAKYVTTAEGSDKARVAKWGVTVTAAGTTFAKEYDTHDTDVKATITKSVISTENVVAPGTSGSMAEITLAGTPEVAVNVSYKADLALSTNWVGNSGDYYCPLIITVEGTRLNGADYTSTVAFETAVENLIAGYSKNYGPKTNLSTDVGTENISISWEWPFSTGDDNDLNDTALGNQAVLGNAATIELTVKTTVTQID